MMFVVKIKKKIENKKINIPSSNTPKEYPIFCFKYLTTNKRYNFEHFSNVQEQLKNKSLILDEIIRLQQKTWMEWGLEGKKTGFESIYINQLNFKPKELILSNDTKVIVFRINSQNWRIIGIRSEYFKSVLHIIGFDFDFSAYNH